MITLKPFCILACTVFVALMLTGCPSDTTAPTANTAKTRTNMQPDSVVGWLYYSLEGDSVVPPSQANSTAWDVRMAYLLCCGQTKQIDVFLNSGTAGPGTTTGAMVASRFENLTSVPSNVVLTVDDTSSTSRIVPVAVIGSNIMFVYDISTHTLHPSPDRCLVIRTATGKTYKFQFTSIYKDNDPAPTIMTPLGYYHFRYQQL